MVCCAYTSGAIIIADNVVDKLMAQHQHRCVCFEFEMHYGARFPCISLLKSLGGSRCGVRGFLMNYFRVFCRRASVRVPRAVWDSSVASDDGLSEYPRPRGQEGEKGGLGRRGTGFEDSL